jgi:hypothetical protein
MEQQDQVLCCDDRDRACQTCTHRIYDKWMMTQMIQPFEQCRGCGNCFDTLNVVRLWSKYLLNVSTHKRNEEYVRRNAHSQFKYPMVERSGYMAGGYQESNGRDDHNVGPAFYAKPMGNFSRVNNDHFERSNSAIKAHPERGMGNSMNYTQIPSLGSRQQFNSMNP